MLKEMIVCSEAEKEEEREKRDTQSASVMWYLKLSHIKSAWFLMQKQDIQRNSQYIRQKTDWVSIFQCIFITTVYIHWYKGLKLL